uniref:hypothetical protein n=1 Tax=Actinoplanes sp. CA-151224 TaxID=3239904 RepID=UPI003F498E3C
MPCSRQVAGHQSSVEYVLDGRYDNLTTSLAMAGTPDATSLTQVLFTVDHEKRVGTILRKGETTPLKLFVGDAWVLSIEWTCDSPNAALLLKDPTLF